MIEIKEILGSDWNRAREIYSSSFNKDVVNSTLPILGKVIGIYVDNILVGFCQIDYLNDVFQDERRAYINSFCIDNKYSNKGYGDMLLKKCIDILRDEGVNYINMTSNKKRVIAHKLYENNNFSIVDTCIFKRNLL